MATPVTDDRNWQCAKSLVQCLDHLFTSEVASDVVFLVGENKSRILAHKTILLSRSPVFYAMFEGLLSEKGEITITDFSRDVFSIFLRYLYTDDIKLDVEVVFPVLEVARKYLVDDLVRKCESFVEDKVDPDNVFLFLDQAHAFMADKIKDICISTISKDILKSPSFDELSADLVKSIIESDELHVDESFVYEAVMRWSEAECGRQGLEVTDTNKRKVLGDIIYNVRFPTMEKEYFRETVMMQGILSADELLEVHRYQHDPKNHPCKVYSTNARKKNKPLAINRFSMHCKNHWDSKGDQDAVSFSSSRNVRLHGVCMFGTSTEERVDIGVYDEEDGCLYRKTHYLPTSKIGSVKLDSVIDIQSGVIYSIIVHGGVRTKRFGVEGKKVVKLQNTSITFTNYDTQTNVNEGQIPGLVLSNT